MWSEFAEKLQAELKDLALCATVLLAVNVSFLAIPSVDNGPEVRSASQIASYLSVVNSVGSVIGGLLLARQHLYQDESAEQAYHFLTSSSNAKRRRMKMAVMYSLPYSLLLWGMVSFLAAFTLEASVKPTRLFTRIPVLCVLAIVVMLLLWCIVMRFPNPIRLLIHLKELVLSTKQTICGLGGEW